MLRLPVTKVDNSFEGIIIFEYFRLQKFTHDAYGPLLDHLAYSVEQCKNINNTFYQIFLLVFKNLALYKVLIRLRHFLPTVVFVHFYPLFIQMFYILLIYPWVSYFISKDRVKFLIFFPNSINLSLCVSLALIPSNMFYFTKYANLQLSFGFLNPSRICSLMSYSTLSSFG